MAINTKKAQRRPVRYNTVDDLLADAERAAAAERAGTLKRTGNWKPGQIFGHLAAWTDLAYDGYPADMPRPPWLIRILLQVMKGRLLRKGLPVGVRMRGVEAGTKFIDDLPLDEGLVRLRKTAARVRTQNPEHDSPVFGPMTREECELMFLRHSELHMSFLHP